MGSWSSRPLVISSPLFYIIHFHSTCVKKTISLEKKKTFLKSTTFFHVRISRVVRGVSDFLDHEDANFFFTSAEGGGGADLVAPGKKVDL
jgi:hypothetical protein